MSDLNESHTRLRKEAWCGEPAIASTNDPTCKFQPLAAGSGNYIFDEYSVIISKMPSGVSPSDFLLEFAKDLNATVKNGTFNNTNTFTKRTKTAPKIGDIYDINIFGPDNGSIVLVALSPGFGVSSRDSWFDIQTVDCDKYGPHPENGAREFGFENVSGGVKFYTRGVSRPGSDAVRAVGASLQVTGWTSMMQGISDSILARGGMPKPGSFATSKKETVL